ncbi:NAD(P)H-dependent oxidoreductase [Fructobacillus sp. M2-14]|uniref:NAD(P)H-dependent oxidoreductase n=1 Tax=Fructobacillus broussonetiae TaxID=2713173 RepID=A0ABS5QZF4_9LACO|nr:NAD(P)H-dependent oxidoreductase [Fructobacillus broussonetiae]MBS9338588.1 NAD(P)H-dependent oxidoreductase [Fructobacillus broussonetiae]
MNILIIQGHPDDQSFTHANAMHSYEHLVEEGMQVQFIDLAIADFDPVLRYGHRVRMPEMDYITKLQQKIAWADKLCFFFPIWWGAEPSVLKGMLDRVLTPGFAYRQPNFRNLEGLLQGRSADLFLTSDRPAYFQRRFGSIVTHWRRDILGRVGIKLQKTRILTGMCEMKDDRKKLAYMEECAQAIYRSAIKDSKEALVELKP